MPSPRKPRPLVLPGLEEHDSNTLTGPWTTLRYNPGNNCLCGRQRDVPIAASLCPHHGYYDNKSKAPMQNEPEPAQESNKRSRVDSDDDDDAEEQDYTPQKSRRTTRARQRNPRPLIPGERRLNRIRSVEEITQEDFLTDLSFIKAKVQHMLNGGHPSDRYLKTYPDCERGPLREINFFSAPLEARKLIYRHFLVPSSNTIIFPGQTSNTTFRQLNPEFQSNILFAHPAIYAECRSILYGENNFVAEVPTDFFYPTGIEGLRASTQRRIKHISLVRKGRAPDLCDITSQAVANSIHNLVLESPAFLGLQTITIRYEVSRPVDLKLYHSQIYLANQGVDQDVRGLYKKTDMVMNAAARVAYKALRKYSPFQGLSVVEDSDHTLWAKGRGVCTTHVIEVCLFRNKEPVVEYQEEKEMLRKVILHMLFQEKEAELPGADEKFRNFMKRYPN